MMRRNSKGQFEKGTCGNPKGRPRKRSYLITDVQLRRDFFDAAEMPVPIVIGNRREVVPARVAIDRQLVAKATSGDIRAMCEYYKRKDRFRLEHVELQLKNLEAIFAAEDRIRMFPEDVTDEFKQIVLLLRRKIDPEFMP
jgi:hypothetical protein